MRLQPAALAGLVSISLCTGALAQDARPLFNFLVDQFNQQLSNQQQNQINNRNWQLFLAAWNDCFNNNDFARCDAALQYPNLTDQDRRRILVKRAEIDATPEGSDQSTLSDAGQVSTQQQLSDQQAQQADAAAKEAEHQRQLSEQADADAEQQRIVNKQIDERVAAERAKDDIAKKEAAKKLVAEAQRKSDADTLFKACFAGDLASCDAAEQMPLSAQERTDLASIRQSVSGKTASTP